MDVLWLLNMISAEIKVTVMPDSFLPFNAAFTIVLCSGTREHLTIITADRNVILTAHCLFMDAHSLYIYMEA